MIGIVASNISAFFLELYINGKIIYHLYIDTKIVLV
jgi:hypothetical protein